MPKLSMDSLSRITTNEFKEAQKNPVVVVLDNVRSMHNVGSIFRTADAFLLEAIYLCGFTPCPPHREIQKTALGATETVAWQYFETAQQAVDLLKKDGYTLLAAEQSTDSLLLTEVNFKKGEKLAVIFGNEVEGIHQDLIDQCVTCLEIPQMGTKHSLNVSIAAGIVLWKLVENQLATLKINNHPGTI